jgi:pimeloyl-ACP methyl ester carboxylesterase
MGLSDWDAKTISFDAFVDDLGTVVDAVGLDRFALLGISQGVAVAVAYAARHPERVSRLVLCGGYAQGWRKRGSHDEIARRGALASLIRHGWGQENPAFRQVFTSLYVPDATHEQMQALNEMQRISAAPENAAGLFDALGDVDVSEALARIKAPTLVLHSRGDGAIPFELGLALARGIPNARFVALESRNHVILPHEPAWERFAREVTTFLGEDEAHTHALPRT